MSLRWINVCLPALLLSACSGGETNSIGETKVERDQRLREKAKTDREGADAEAIENKSRNEVLATAINSAGYRCARVTAVYSMADNITVECVEYRNGLGRVKYRIDPNAGTVKRGGS
jgi:hypothetical protein